MSITTEFDIQKIDDELLNRFRSAINSYDINNKVTVTTLNLTTTTAVLYAVPNMNYVTSVTLNSVLLTFGTDYLIHWRGINRNYIELLNTPTSGLSLDIVYGKVGSNGSFVYPDFPRSDLGINNYPRVGFKTNFRREMVGGDGSKIVINNTGLLQIKVIGLSTSQVTIICTELDNYIVDNFKSFYYIRYIDPASLSNYDNFQDNINKTFSRVLEYNIPDKYQIR